MSRICICVDVCCDIILRKLLLIVAFWFVQFEIVCIKSANQTKCKKRHKIGNEELKQTVLHLMHLTGIDKDDD